MQDMRIGIFCLMNRSSTKSNPFFCNSKHLFQFSKLIKVLIFKIVVNTITSANNVNFEQG
jgi:hypothetical protein